MALPDDEGLLSECRSGWLTVEGDFSARLTRQEQLKHGREGMRARVPASPVPETRYELRYR